MADDSKRCPYCAEEIRAEARKCRYCGSFVEGGSPVSRTWYRSPEGKMIAGVCAGLAEQFDVSVTIIRLAFLLSAPLGFGIGIILYVALWVIMPTRVAFPLGGDTVARVEQRSDYDRSAHP